MITPIVGYNGSLAIGASGSLPITNWTLTFEPRYVDVTGIDSDGVDVWATTNCTYNGTCSCLYDSSNDFLKTLHTDFFEFTSAIFYRDTGQAYISFATMDPFTLTAGMARKFELICDINDVWRIQMELHFNVVPTIGVVEA